MEPSDQPSPPVLPEEVNQLFDAAQEALRTTRTAEDVDDDETD